MGLWKGRASCTVLDVSSQVSRESVHTGLVANGFVENPIAREQSIGWVHADNILLSDFSELDGWEATPIYYFSWRKDVKRIPAMLFNASVRDAESKWVKENRAERCPSDVKDAIGATLMQDWMSRALPSTTIVECMWDSVEGTLWLSTQNIVLVDEVLSLLRASFAVSLTFSGSEDFEKKWVTTAERVLARTGHASLFLNWLLYRAESAKEVLTFPEVSLEGWHEDLLLFSPEGGSVMTLKGADALSSQAAKGALSLRKNVSRMTFSIRTSVGEVYTYTLRGTMAVSVKLPKVCVDKDSSMSPFSARVCERAVLLDRSEEYLESLVGLYLISMSSSNMEKTLTCMAGWESSLT